MKSLVCQKLKDISNKLDLLDISCSVDFADHKRWLGLTYLTKALDREGTFYSSENLMAYSSKRRKTIPMNDLDLNGHLNKLFHKWDEKSHLRYGTCSILEEFGYRYKYTIKLTLLGMPDLACWYFLYPKQEIIQDSPLYHEIMNELNAYSLYIIGLVSTVEKNYSPHRIYSMFRPKTLQVLECLSQGMSREEIAATCHLSNRGVDYHVDKLKREFSVKNNSHLVHLCNRLLII